MVYSRPNCAPQCSSMGDSNARSAVIEPTIKTVLYPFHNQVGGHTQLMLLDSSTVCKPLIEKELFFYLNIPKELTYFVPNYKGVVEIAHSDTRQIIYNPFKRNGTRDKGEKNVRSRSGRDIASISPHQQLKVQLLNCSGNRLLQKKHDSLKVPLKYSSRPSQRYFLLLENITNRFHLPCVLDLKMGTRQHGDDATDEKRSRQMAKCAASTSARLGVRLGGMQLLDSTEQQFTFRDKYFGRSLDEQGLHNALQSFFHNGRQMRSKVIEHVLVRLRQLRVAIERQTSFRFYSTSLLIAYEGCDDCEREGTSVEKTQRKAHFKKSHETQAQSCAFPVEGVMFNHRLEKDEDEGLEVDQAELDKSEEDSCKPNGNELEKSNEEDGMTEDEELDDGGMGEEEDGSSMDVDDYYQTVGRANRMQQQLLCNRLCKEKLFKSNQLKKRRRANSFSCDEDSSLDSSGDSQSYSIRPTIVRSQSSSSNRIEPVLPRPQVTSCDSSLKIDVRIIDFAHTALNEQDRHPGPDLGFLFGLDNLIKMLGEVHEQNSPLV